MKNKKGTRKPFDCVASKRKAQARIYKKIKGVTAEQEIAYFEKATQKGPFAELWRNLVARGREARTSGKWTEKKLLKGITPNMCGPDLIPDRMGRELI